MVTAHRRESFGEPLYNICQAILDTKVKFPETQFVYPVHFNPNVRKVVNEILGNQTDIFLIDPLDYQRLIWLMEKSTLVLTDSGGIQEEAPALGKPVLVMRDVTERVEGVNAGTAKLVGTQRAIIVDELSSMLTNRDGVYTAMSKAVNPYGDGTTSLKILSILKQLI